MAVLRNRWSWLILFCMTALLIPLLSWGQGRAALKPPTAVDPSNFLPSPFETHVLGQRTWLTGSTASLRVVTLNHNAQPIFYSKRVRNAMGPVRNAHVTIKLTNANARDIPLFTGRTNAGGTLDAEFPVPNLTPGSYELTVTTNYPLGMDTVKQSVTLSEAAQVLLTTDKPLYQPSQTIHIRALALTKPNRAPAAEYPLTFEIEDPKGNKVFKQTESTSPFGVASASFQLADEINLGPYTIRAALGPTEGRTASGRPSPITIVEKKVNVKRYVLPKFKIQFEASKKFYLPGEMLDGTVQSDYFFGKPIANSEVRIKLSTFDIGWNDFAELKGTTNNNGTYKFSQLLPTHFAGVPLEKGNALLKVDVAVIDKAEHQEKVSQTFPVAKEAIKVTILPESGSPVANVPNIFYVLTNYPDGSPAPARFSASGPSFYYPGRTDKLGIGQFTIVPRTGTLSLQVRAEDAQGNRGVIKQKLNYETRNESVLLRTDKAVADVGEDLTLTILTSAAKVFGPRSTVFIDAIKDQQTVLTKSVDLQQGRARLTLPLDGTLAGTLVLHAYLITPAGQIVRDTNIVYVNPAKDLNVNVEVSDGEPTNEGILRPGDTAQLKFSVTDTKDDPVLASLGVTIVDESVFTLQEMQPGLEKVYFTLERELLKPRYEIHGFEAAPLLMRKPTPHPVPFDAQKQRAARVLFAASTPELGYSIRVNTWEQKSAQLRDKWQAYVQTAGERIWKALQMHQKQKRPLPKPETLLDALLNAKLLVLSDVKDPLGNRYQVESDGPNLHIAFKLISAGMDRKFGTDDDVISYPGRKFWIKANRQFARGGRIVEMMAVMDSSMDDTNVRKDFDRDTVSSTTSDKPVRIRQFFPETLFVNPQIITDEHGHATVPLTMADSITTWRLTALGNSATGQLGSTTTPLRVFQPFFIDLDLPVSLTQNDEVAIPVAVYNYLPEAQTVQLRLEKTDWFTPLDSTNKSVRMNKGDVNVVHFRIKAKDVGSHRLTVFADGSTMQDAIRRQITVVPDGQEIWTTINDRLEGNVTKTITIPHSAIDDASNILVKVYPGAFSQVIEGLDSMLRMPHGCFEQTSSTTYPNVLVTDYLKRTKKINPEIQMKATQHINLGYQRLVSFEVDGGGFSWFGNAPAHKVLTAYGLLEFHDMSQVHDVDPNVIKRTQNWLADLQKPDGSWELDQGGIAEGIINRQSDELRVTAYIGWALAESGNQGDAVEKAMRYVIPKIDGVNDPYSLAVIANGLAGWKINHPSTGQAMERLADMAIQDTKTAYWKSMGPTMTHGRGETGDLETTALAVYALLKYGRQPTLVNKALTYLIQSKDAFGTWQNTQATVWSLKALLLAMEKGTSETTAQVTVFANDRKASEFQITPKNSDVMRQVDLKMFVQEGTNRIRIEFHGTGAPLYQITAKHYMPWRFVGGRPEPLAIDVAYDRTDLTVNDTVNCSVKVTNNQPLTANMVMLDLGIPPGFDVQSGSLAKLVDNKTIEKFSMTGRQLTIYLDKIEPSQPLMFEFQLKAKYPIRAKSGRSRAYEYYAPKIAGVSQPIDFVVRQ